MEKAASESKSTARGGPLPAFGPDSVGYVPPLTMDQVVLRARTVLGARQWRASRLFVWAVALLFFVFLMDVMAYTGIIPAGLRLSTSLLFDVGMADYERFLVDTGVVLFEVILIAGGLTWAARFPAGRTKGAWVAVILGAVGIAAFAPTVATAIARTFATDWIAALTGMVFPLLGIIACLFCVAGGLVGRLRPVKPYES